MKMKRFLSSILVFVMLFLIFSDSIQIWAISQIKQVTSSITNEDKSKSGQAFTKDNLSDNGPLALPAEVENENKHDNNENTEEQKKYSENVDLNKASEKAAENIALDDKVTLIVELEKKSLLDEGYSANDISRNIRARFHASSQERYIDKVKSRITRKLKSDVEILYDYKVAITGMAITTEYKNLEKIKKINGVKDAWVSQKYKLSEVEPKTANGSNMIGADSVWNETGYTGQGMKIAIIDTGLDVKHKSFQPLSEDKLTEDSMTNEDVQSVWGELNASKQTSNPIGVYRNSKIPYAYNYVAKNYDVAHPPNTSDHGTHVAGIAAANKIDTTDVVGIAPDAQIVVMQVFSPQGGADFADVLAAMEDAVYLDVDVMNLSLGSTAGFTDSDEKTNEIFDKFSKTDIQVAIASGNDTNSALNNNYGNNKSLSSNPDIGLVGTPATYTEGMTVASMDNTSTKSLTFTVGGKKVGYNDTASSSHTNWISKLGALKEYEYVWLGEGVYGKSVDEFKNANNGAGVSGKIALVARGGGASFLEKQANAGEAGAIACIVYNDRAGNINMNIKDGKGYIPSISISKNDGKYMISLLENGVGKITTGNGTLENIISSDTVMSEFSSWGVTPSLKLKPDITGVGGNVNSTRNNSTYGVMSGTSMATPQVAGATAIAMQYIRDKFGDSITEEQIRNLTSALLMSTADPAITEGIEYSPRLQGAGLVNIYDAITTNGYITNDDQIDGRPKAELGNSEGGTFNFKFKINNLTDKELYYQLSSSLLTEGVIKSGDNTFMTSTPVALESKINFEYDGRLYYDFNNDGTINSADVRVLLMVINGDKSLCKKPDENLDINKDGTIDKKDLDELTNYVAEFQVNYDPLKEELVKVPANGEIEVKATITLSEKDKQYINNNFENGMYVEGFVYAESLNGDIEKLSMPVMGFYGDWTKAPIFDEGKNYYWESEGQASLYPTAIYTDRFMLGVNPYVKTPFKEEHATVSLQNGLAEFNIGLLRNAKKLTFTVRDAKTNKEYWRLEQKDIAKTYFSSNDGMIIPYWIANPMSGERILWNGTDSKGNPIPENTKTILKVEATVDYEGAYKNQSFEVPIWIDNTKPEIVNIDNLKPVVKDGKVNLELVVRDNQHIAAVLFESPDGTIMAKHALDNYKPGTTESYTFDITGFGEEFNIILADYSCNELVESIEIDLGAGWDEGKLPLTQLDPNKLYAFETLQYGALSNGWYSANKNDLSEAKNITYANNSRYYSAEYIDGFIYAQTTTGDLVVISPRSTHWKENVLNKQKDVILYDMAFDYSSKTLYAVGWDFRIGSQGEAVLVTVDLNSGEIKNVATLSGMNSDTMTTLACTTEGQLYGIDKSGYLNKISKESGKVEVIGVTDFAKGHNFFGVNVIQSMAYDHNTDKVYWNAYSTKYDVNIGQHLVSSGVFTVDLETAKTEKVGELDTNCGVGLFIPYDGGDILPQAVKPTKVEPVESTITILPTQTKRLELKWTPWNSELSHVDWSVENEAPIKSGEKVVEVDAKGKITAISSGTADVVAKTTIYPTDKSEGQEIAVKFNVNVLQSVEEMYGFLKVDINDMKKEADKWISFNDANPTEYRELTGKSDLSYTAATYYNGYIYGVVLGQENADLYKMKVDKKGKDVIFGDSEHIGTLGRTNIVDMAFDYTTGRMYGLENHQSFMYLSIIDLETGKLDRVSKIEDIIVTLACDDKGNLYGINEKGVLHTFDSETGEATVVYDTGVQAGGFLQSMTYDYNSGNLYWAQCADVNKSSFFLLSKTEKQDGQAIKTEWKTVKLGDVGGKKGSEIIGLFTIPEKEPDTAYIEVTGININEQKFSMIDGAKTQLSVTTQPRRPTVKRLEWESNNEKVVKVDSLGMLTAVAPGTATITVSITDRKSNKIYKDTVEVTVIESSGKIQAFLNNDAKTGYFNHWISIPDYNTSKYELLKNTIDAYTLVAGDYYDGYVYGYDSNGLLLRIDPKTFNYKTIGKHGIHGTYFKILDMTYDYKNFRMLVLGSTDNWSEKTAIYSVDLKTGALNKVTDIKGDQGIYGLAYGKDKYYGVKSNGTICTVDIDNGNLTDIASTNINLNTGKSSFNTTMTYDHNKDRLYMAPVIKENDKEIHGDLYMMDATSNEVTTLGKIGEKGSFVASMYIVPKKGSVPEHKKVTGVELSHDFLRMNINEEKELIANVMPSTASNKKVKWTTSDSNIVEVNDGKLKAKKTGTVTVTVTTEEGSFIDTCDITVIDPQQEKGNTAYAFSKEHKGLISFNTNAPSSTITKLFEYQDVDKILATTMIDGALYFLKKEGFGYPKLCKMDLKSYSINEIGYVQITVDIANDMTYDPFTKMIYVTSGFYIYVVNPETGDVITSVNLNNTTTHGIASTNGNLYVVSNNGSNKNIISEIDTNAIFNVSEGATLSPNSDYKIVGTLNPMLNTSKESTMEYDYVSRKIYINVEDSLYTIDLNTGKTSKIDTSPQFKAMTFKAEENPVIRVTGVELNKETMKLKTGMEQQLIAKVYPDKKGTNKKVIWESSDSSIVSVDNDGKIKALKEGTATITVTTEDGGYKDSCTITVIKPGNEDWIYGYSVDEKAFVRFDRNMLDVNSEIVLKHDAKYNEYNDPMYPNAVTYADDGFVYFIQKDEKEATHLYKWDLKTNNIEVYISDIVNLYGYPLYVNDMTAHNRVLYLTTSVGLYTIDLNTKKVEKAIDGEDWSGTGLQVESDSRIYGQMLDGTRLTYKKENGKWTVIRGSRIGIKTPDYVYSGLVRKGNKNYYVADSTLYEVDYIKHKSNKIGDIPSGKMTALFTIPDKEFDNK